MKIRYITIVPIHLLAVTDDYWWSSSACTKVHCLLCCRYEVTNVQYPISNSTQ